MGTGGEFRRLWIIATPDKLPKLWKIIFCLPGDRVLYVVNALDFVNFFIYLDQ